MIGATGYYVHTFVINALLMIRGNKILELFKAQSIEFIDSEYESKIGFRIAFIQFILFLISETISAVLKSFIQQKFLVFQNF
jgi:hypothetical protein